MNEMEVKLLRSCLVNIGDKVFPISFKKSLNIHCMFKKRTENTQREKSHLFFHFLIS